MAENSLIEWTNHTFNPWIGCQHVSAGCKHCYAENLMDHRYGRVEWGPHGERVRTAEANWKKPLKWNEEAQRTGARPKVFCASLADWLDNKVPREWREDLGDLIKATPNLDWLLLTKRIENYERLAPWVCAPNNVWLGVTAENQAAYRRRWPILSDIPAVLHFISYEPALGPLDMSDEYHSGFPDWVIAGGESGPHARFMDPSWAGQLMKECASLDIAFFMKQMTGKRPIPESLMRRQFPTPFYLQAA